ncbi:MAG: hypothetical protein JOZ32_06040 [Bryobacterales bacterium]|nr:hypothetical protein [Bryobacterales bacterium]
MGSRLHAEGRAVALVGPPLGGWDAQVVEDQLDAVPLDHCAAPEWKLL